MHEKFKKDLTVKIKIIEIPKIVIVSDSSFTPIDLIISPTRGILFTDSGFEAI
ncbi:MAG: hypothetical protein OHK0037_21350 [Elainellaceae cyanobacterium]